MKDNMPNIGIVGFGFIGKAVCHGFSLHANIKIYDKYGDSPNTLEDTINSSDYIFVGVPTPMRDDGTQDLTYLDDAIGSIAEVATHQKIIIIKSTVVPGTNRSFALKYPKHYFISNPEFLTQRTFRLDFINSARIIVGGQPQATSWVRDLYRIRFPHTPIYRTTWEAAEIVKYMTNCFFALKISFCNEVYQLCDKLQIPYNDLKAMWLSDGRVGNSHTDVPGHDGDLGYGGKCFTKDVQAFITWAESTGMTFETLRAAESVNTKVRSLKDWENIKGATSQCQYIEE